MLLLVDRGRLKGIGTTDGSLKDLWCIITFLESWEGWPPQQIEKPYRRSLCIRL
jgi:hypothetical protein